MQAPSAKWETSSLEYVMCSPTTARRAELQNTQETLQAFIQLTSEISTLLNASTQHGVSLDVAAGALGKGFLD